ncbi:hypothetical protein L873DRAFT_1794875 [Choiromyces venosus 120613-1]|uniref:Uncharacterized protein n=1 Tax=Choiromyces venosus 120613-1 TaxID=1336337 RepID=A0A3N4J4R0_9PEZI|nr:hypothetical protein L873DRAFT_1794875 [Choiromyces venosus 120613-1]
MPAAYPSHNAPGSAVFMPQSPVSILGPIISRKAALDSEVGHAAWAQWVTENSTMETSISSLTSNPPRQNPRSVNTSGRISTVLKKREQQLYHLRWYQPLKPGETDIRAVSSSAVTLILTQQVVTLAPPEAALLPGLARDCLSRASLLGAESMFP